MDANKLVNRITRNGLLLAILCVMGMFSVPLGDYIKISFQLLVVFVIAFLTDGPFDGLIITGCYLLLGLVAPIYAGFSSGLSPTFGYVISFVVVSPILYYLNKIPKIPVIPRMALACLVGLIVVYAIGSIFMMLYLSWDLPATLLTSVVQSRCRQAAHHSPLSCRHTKTRREVRHEGGGDFR